MLFQRVPRGFKMYYWFMLALAVFAEVLSTIGMKYAATSSPIIGYVMMALMISFSFYAFSRAVVHIPLAVSYAIWEGLGLLLIGIAGVVLDRKSTRLNSSQSASRMP